jgi:toxin ParE1/3/4
VRRLDIVQAARDDLRAIARFTDETWGRAQERRYLAALMAAMQQLRDSPGLGRPRDDLRPGLRSLIAGRHVDFYRETADAILVLRVLHERMDIRRHLVPKT